MTDKEILNFLTREDYAVRCDIGQGITNYLNVGFQPSQIYILDYVDIKRKPSSVMNGIFKFLGVEEFDIDDKTLRTNYQVNSDSGTKDLSTKRRVVEHTGNRVPEILGKRLKPLLEEFYKDVKEGNLNVMKRIKEETKRNRDKI